MSDTDECQIERNADSVAPVAVVRRVGMMMVMSRHTPSSASIAMAA